MKNSLFLIFVGIVIVTLSSCDEDCNLTDMSPTKGREYVCKEYRFIASIPESCETGGCGLIVDVHGLFSSPESQEANTRLRELGSSAMERGASTPYVVIQPRAPETLTGWTEEDAAYIHGVVQAVTETWDIDKDRIHFTGFSMGGGMTQWMICNQEGYYASYAPTSAGSDHICFDTLPSLPETPILFIIGEKDPWSWAGAQIYKAAVLKAMEPYTEEITDQGTGYTRTRYTGNGMQFDWLQHCGGHCVLGGAEEADGCTCDCKISHGETVLDFFIANPK